LRSAIGDRVTLTSPSTGVVTLLLQRVVLERSGAVHVRADDIDELLQCW
jgi:hypothetical protein